MLEDDINSRDPVTSLGQAFLLDHPRDAARKIETMPVDEVAVVFSELPAQVLTGVMEKLTPPIAEAIISKLPDKLVVDILAQLGLGTCIPLLARMEKDRLDRYLALLHKDIADEFKSLLEYPVNSAGRLMNPRILAFNESIKVEQALQQLKHLGITTIPHLFLLDDQLKLQSQVDIHRISLANKDSTLAAIAMPVVACVNAMDQKTEVIEMLEKYHVSLLPVVNADYRLVGVIEGKELIETLREDIVTNMQTMVGASKDERALSSSAFAIRKRLPWLQINLLTAFLAASVVGMFEDTIARYTALAVLLPIAAGQSGNTGAQALAVTMRGLTLREVTVRDWYRIVLKELAAGFVNGLGVAVVCALGVYLWSSSTGLALVMALSMVISMTLAGTAGALVPMLLKRLGLDPAQSSSIVLTTVTDIAGFMSFLGIATLLSGMLDATL